MDSFVSEYISNVDVLRNQKVVNINVQKIYDTIFKSFKNTNDVIELHLCNTYSKDCYLMSFGNKRYLVYNEYLTDVFRELNLISLCDVFDDDIKKIIAKLLTEEYCILAEYPAAQYMAQKYSSFPYYRYKSNVNASINKKSSTYTTIQTWFIIAHEIAHWYRFEYLSDYEVLVHKRTLLTNMLGERDDLTSTQIRDYYESNDEIIEECICDSTAMLIVINDKCYHKYSKD